MIRKDLKDVLLLKTVLVYLIIYTQYSFICAINEYKIYHFLKYNTLKFGNQHLKLNIQLSDDMCTYLLVHLCIRTYVKLISYHNNKTCVGLQIFTCKR